MANNDWTTMPFTEAVLVNPPVGLTRGTTYPFVEMAAVVPSARSVPESEIREFKGGGARFIPGDTLMARITPCLENGKIARFWPTDGTSPGFGSTEFIVIRGRDGVTDNDFAYYLTQWPEFRQFAISQMTGSSGRQRVPASSLAHFEVTIPPIPVQRCIAHILGALDDKIALNRRMNRTLEKMAQAIFKSWFIDFEPVRAKAEGRDPNLPKEIADLFPDSFEDSDIGPIPRGWKVVKLQDIADVNWGDTSVTKKSYVRQGYLAYSAKGPDGFLPYYDYSRTGVVLSAIGANSGRTWLAQGKWSCIKNTIRFWATDAEVSTEYLYYATLGEHHWPRRGSAQPFISQGDARNKNILKPNNALARLFGDIVQSFHEKIFANNNSSHTLAALRDTLLPKLLSGEIEIEAAERTAREIVG